MQRSLLLVPALKLTQLTIALARKSNSKHHFLRDLRALPQTYWGSLQRCGNNFKAGTDNYVRWMPLVIAGKSVNFFRSKTKWMSSISVVIFY
jgi:hypothetical protein